MPIRRLHRSKPPSPTSITQPQRRAPPPSQTPGLRHPPLLGQECRCLGDSTSRRHTRHHQRDPPHTRLRGGAPTQPGQGAPLQGRGGAGLCRRGPDTAQHHQRLPHPMIEFVMGDLHATNTTPPPPPSRPTAGPRAAHPALGRRSCATKSRCSSTRSRRRRDAPPRTW